MMTSNYDVYASQPAFPFLASSLLATYNIKNSVTDNNGTCNSSSKPDHSSSSSWDLKPSFDAFHEISKYRNNSNHLFRCGLTIGFSYLKEWNTSNPDQNRDVLGEIPRRLLASFLLSLDDQEARKEDNPVTRVYIIHPNYSTTFSPNALLEAILGFDDRDHPRCETEGGDHVNNPRALSRDQAIDLLDHVELLSVHDFASATQAISQVSDTLYKTQQRRHDNNVNSHNENKDDDDDDDDDDNQEIRNKARSPPTTLFIIEGLDTLAENLIRNSNALRGSAVLTPALRTLTYLSRTYAAFLSVMLVNTTGLGPSAPPPLPTPSFPPQSSLSAGPASLSQGINHHGNPQTVMNPNNMKSAGGLYSVFSRTQPRKQENGGQADDDDDDDDGGDDDEPLPLLHTLLSRTMDQGIDVHLLFQIRKKQPLLEVIKDRTGDGLGKWCVWG